MCIYVCVYINKIISITSSPHEDEETRHDRGDASKRSRWVGPPINTMLMISSFLRQSQSNHKLTSGLLKVNQSIHSLKRCSRWCSSIITDPDASNLPNLILSNVIFGLVFTSNSVYSWHRHRMIRQTQKGTSEPTRQETTRLFPTSRTAKSTMTHHLISSCSVKYFWISQYVDRHQRIEAGVYFW